MLVFFLLCGVTLKWTESVHTPGASELTIVGCNVRGVLNKRTGSKPMKTNS